MRIEQAILDTGAIVAVLSKRDANHRWAIDVFRELPLPAVTCEAVLSEAFFHLRKSKSAIAALVELIEHGAFRIVPSVNVVAVARCAARFEVDYADACLVQLSEQFPQATVVTTDQKDFAFLRRFGNEAVPHLAP